jgi:hypothetical protein
MNCAAYKVFTSTLVISNPKLVYTYFTHATQKSDNLLSYVIFVPS